MADTMTLTIQLSVDAREFIRRRVESGEFRSESDVVWQGVEWMMSDEQHIAELLEESSAAELQSWLTYVVGPACDRVKADPSSRIPIEEVPRLLEERCRLRKMTV